MRGILPVVAILLIAGCGAVGLPRPLTSAEADAPIVMGWFALLMRASPS